MGCSLAGPRLANIALPQLGRLRYIVAVVRRALSLLSLLSLLPLLLLDAGPFALLPALTGCTDRETRENSAKDKKAAAAASALPPSASAAGRGMYAPGGDPRVLELLRKALACKWDAAGPSEWCDDARAWREAREMFEGGRADGPLVTLLADVDDRVRLLAAQNLAVFGQRYRSDKVLASGIVRAAEGEQSARVAPYLGAAVARIDVDKTELFDRVRAIAAKHALVALRVALVSALAQGNQSNQSSTAVFTVTLDLLRDPEKEVRAAALGALWTAGSRHPEEACRAWRDHIDDGADDDIAARSCDYLTWAGNCQTHYDALLDSEERRFKAGRTSKALFAKALGNLCEDPKTTATQKARAGELVRRLSEQKTTDRDVRGAALGEVMRCEPANGRAFVGRYVTDDDAHVRDRAVDLLKPR